MLIQQSADIQTQASEFLDQAFEFADQSALVGRSCAPFTIFDLLVQEQPDDLGDAMRYRPGSALAIDFRFQTGKQSGKEGVFGMDGGPGDLTK